MTTDKFIELTQIAKEGSNLEFKRSTPWESNEFKVKIVKSLLAFSNVRDGGALVIGVERQADMTYKFVGMDPDHFETWDEDHIASFVANYADPYVKFSMETAKYDGKDFIVILVSPFDEIPVICKKTVLIIFVEVLSILGQTEFQKVQRFQARQNYVKYLKWQLI